MANSSRKHNERHGLTTGQRHPLWELWNSMRSRCYNPKMDAYPYYGGRGIKVCEQWRNSFATFVTDVGDRPGPQYSLDRIDNDGDYEPGNVRWVTHTTQMRKSRHTKLTMTDAREIRRLYFIERRSQQAIADHYGVCQVNISEITLGKTWKEQRPRSAKP